MPVDNTATKALQNPEKKNRCFTDVAFITACFTKFNWHNPIFERIIGFLMNHTIVIYYSTVFTSRHTLSRIILSPQKSATNITFIGDIDNAAITRALFLVFLHRYIPTSANDISNQHTSFNIELSPAWPRMIHHSIRFFISTHTS